jgi:HrpA-like RNA helicase
MIGGDRKIKGGGRAVMSRESQEALIGLLMRLSEEDDNSTSNSNSSNSKAVTESLSKHDRKHQEKKFLRRLVRDYEKKKLKKKFTNHHNNDNNKGRSTSPVPTTNTTSSTTSNIGSRKKKSDSGNITNISSSGSGSGNGNEKVRIELVEAIFKKDENKKKSSSHKKKKSDDKKSSKKKKKDDDDDDEESHLLLLDFKEGMKKVIVVPKSTTSTNLLKLAQSKLRMKKKPVRVFLKILSSSRTTPTIIDLNDDDCSSSSSSTCGDLSGIEDGTVIYITSTVKPTVIGATPTTTTTTTATSDDGDGNGNDNNNVNCDTEDDNDNDNDKVVVVDPLELVKRAYERQEQHQRGQKQKRRQQQQQQQQHQKQQQQQIPRTQQIVEEEKKRKNSIIRSGLPAASYKDKIIDAITTNRVVVLCGATGCGKSTQVPQFLLEHQEEEKENEKNVKRLRNNEDEIVIAQSESESESLSSRRIISRCCRRRPYIVVTQPRKVAAISLANRVSEERGCPLPGQVHSEIGYMVRSDRRVEERSCRIIYLTVGILLRMLVQPSSSQPPPPQDNENNNDDDNNSSMLPPPLSIDTISHLIIDEVHERDVNTDFTLTLLKGLMGTPRLSHLRLILMSATASSELFVRYFTTTTTSSSRDNSRFHHPSPDGIATAITTTTTTTTTTTPVVLEIPGRTFPVDIKWLPDCEMFSGASIWRPNNNNNNSGGDGGGNNKENDDIGGPTLSPRSTDRIDDRFIRSLIAKIVLQQQSEGQLHVQHENNPQYRNMTRNTGAILVFLPGRGEIESLASCLYGNETIVGDRNLCTVLKLHSAVPKSEQDRVFKPAVQGTVKIVLATNIAETSVTIPDVSHVIDTCRVKESRYNASTRIKELVTVWTSRASLKQRSGRAGRTSAGVCWRLCTEDFCEQTMLDQTTPEMLRTPLDELILQICLLYEQRRDEFYRKKKEAVGGSGKTGGGAGSSFATGAKPIKFLSMTPAPPPKNSLLQACRHLLEVDALTVVDTGSGSGGDNDTDEEELTWSYRLTPLGYHLSRLPMDAKVGKVLIVGCILGCLDGALTVAAALSCTKSCFLAGFGRQVNPAAIQARDSLIENGFGGKDWMGGTVKGDLIAVIAAYRAWKKQKSDGQKWKFCNAHALDNNTLKDMNQLFNQFTDLIIDAGFVTRPPRTTDGGRHNTGSLLEMEDCNHASEDALLTSCCLVAGLYPNICSLTRPRKGGPKGGRLLSSDGDECRPQSNSFQRERVKQAAETGEKSFQFVGIFFFFFPPQIDEFNQCFLSLSLSLSSSFK